MNNGSKNPEQIRGDTYMKPNPNIVGDKFPLERLTMDAQAFDEAINSHGLYLLHYRAVRCPGGLVDIDDIRRPHEDHAGCSNGFLLTKVGRVQALLTSNSSNPSHMEAGIVNGSTIVASFPRFYDDPAEKRVYVSPYDRFYLEDESILTSEWQLVRAHETGLDKARFPIVAVEQAIDSSLTRYGPETYDILDGKLRWRGGLGPQPGTVYTLQYFYSPYWYVSQLVHEIRVVGTKDYVTGAASVSRMPFSAHLTRENVHDTVENDPLAPQSNQQAGPSTVNFGPR